MSDDDNLVVKATERVAYSFTDRRLFTGEEIKPAKLPDFYCMKTLMGYSGQDLNRVTLYMPNEQSFVLYKIGEARTLDANQRCNELAAKLNELWNKNV